MFAFDPDKVLQNIRAADTEDLLDRVTAFRAGMERRAIAMIETELRDRGIDWAQIADREAQCEAECLFLPDGTAYECSLCRRPAVEAVWGWHRVFGIVPLFPRRLRYCKGHATSRTEAEA